ncbi:hypothetical protein CNMCM5793_005342 [Aspergillus hiratsukae]|uniref:Uncharacterized protein n=1 Tax=Aspergillus hiratsukae TaxID=1194566 RepID=A0A8H6PGT6_9EURO|nr:hypothetical protein CNMCM5793_005342 [Aspergillus hiratsukae]KAF7171165.1 hypothetical protein CNMCM6106_005636 [Aspergillus hiratsukae]
MAVDHPDMHNPQADEPSPPQSVHDSEDESIAGSEPASKSLWEAVLQCDYREVEAILENDRVKVDEKGPDGRTALSFAIEMQTYDVVPLLLDNGPTPILEMIRTASRSFGPLCEGGKAYPILANPILANPILDDRGDAPLAVAAAKGDEVFVREILSIDSKTKLDINLENKNTDGYTALSLAAREGHDGIVKLLVELGGAEINTQGNEETSPLMCAAAAGSPRCLGYLLSKGADLGNCTWWERFLETRSRQRKENPEPCRYQKPDHFLCQKPFQRQQSDLEELISWLQSSSLKDEKPPFLWLAVEYEDEEIVELLLDLGAEPDTRGTTEHQMTPLIRALKIGNMDIVRLLKKKDRCSMHILVDEADDVGEEQALEFVHKLLAQGYNLSKRNLEGQNPVHIACYKGRKQFVEEFLHPKYEKALIHYADNSGKTPLQGRDQ